MKNVLVYWLLCNNFAKIIEGDNDVHAIAGDVKILLRSRNTMMMSLQIAIMVGVGYFPDLRKR